MFSFTINGTYCKRGCTKRSLLVVTARLVLPGGGGGGGIGGREREFNDFRPSAQSHGGNNNFV